MSFLTEQEIIRRLDFWGHAAHPHGRPDALVLPSIKKLGVDSPEIRTAVESYKAMHVVPLSEIIARNNPQLALPAVNINGDIDDATAELIAAPRCWCKDYDPDIGMAVGSGNWPRCHGIGEGHRARVKFLNQPPAFLQPYWADIWNDHVAAYREQGLDFEVRNDLADDKVNLLISFTTPPANDGWIGLATVLNGQKCTGRGWAKFDKNYRPANIRNEWTTLFRHEFGHCCGLGHSNGGTMNPYIIKGLKPRTWKGDPSQALIAQRFGGEPLNLGERQFDLVVAKRYDDDGSYETVSVVKENITSVPGFWG